MRAKPLVLLGIWVASLAATVQLTSYLHDTPNGSRPPETLWQNPLAAALLRAPTNEDSAASPVESDGDETPERGDKMSAAESPRVPAVINQAAPTVRNAEEGDIAGRESSGIPNNKPPDNEKPQLEPTRPATPPESPVATAQPVMTERERIRLIVTELLQAQESIDQARAREPSPSFDPPSPNRPGEPLLSGNWRCSNGMSLVIDQVTTDDMFITALDRLGRSVGTANIELTAPNCYSGEYVLELQGRRYGQMELRMSDAWHGQLFCDFFVVDRNGRQILRIPASVSIWRERRFRGTND